MTMRGDARKVSEKGGTMQSRIATLVSPKILEWDVVQLPDTPPTPKDVVCRTKVSCISPGTEIAAFTGMDPLRPGPVYPRLVGYCNVAEVLEVGSEVAKARVGDYILTHQSHRSAFITHEDNILAHVSDKIDLAQASSTYLFHLAYSALLRSKFAPGHKVAVVGAGTLGLAAIALATASGAEVVAYSSQPNVADRATSFGARAVLQKADESQDGTADILISTSNTWEDWHCALRAASPGGTIAILGFPGRGVGPAQFNPLASQYVYDKQLTLVACGQVPNLDVSPLHIRFTLKRNMEWLLSLVANGRLPAHLMVSEVVPAANLEKIYERLANRDQSLVTAALEWEN
ncbi:zinc-binding dehydrogenase [Chelativorans sp. ZYF759]|uniref:zinc-dependent alcohol dehydrogenase n=1 Tax=Chelativorans sp. ZYF759 TaxID=2692213 RepID=UPI00145E1FA6|nr:zinc-binding alcohol dehydrogenase [Chelativorans sp. ZYF759]NMG42024.1 zinc-binding dehydrogenase [Chelativorans sp. ZYF759]